jgi:hypothetical protein
MHEGYPLANALGKKCLPLTSKPGISGLDFWLAHRTLLLTVTQRICHQNISGLRIFLEEQASDPHFSEAVTSLSKSYQDVPQATLGK